MLVRFFCTLALALPLTAAPVLAQTQSEAPRTEQVAPEVAPLLTALGVYDLLPILSAEGMAYAESLEGEMFPGRGNARWQATIGQIYSTDRMGEIMAREIEARLPADAYEPLMAFFTSERGKRIIELEVSAREAMLDEGVEAASRERFAELSAARDPRLDLIERFVQANDLIEMNVAGALNSNLAFYRGLMDGEAFDGSLTEEEMLADVWSQTDDIRNETYEWLYGYLTLAYQPLEDADLEAYIAMSESPAGEALNTALFAGFDVLFSQISLDLGRGAARMMAGEDI